MFIESSACPFPGSTVAASRQFTCRRKRSWMPMPKSDIFSSHVDENITSRANCLGSRMIISIRHTIDFRFNIFLSVICPIRGRCRGFATHSWRRSVYTILSQMTVHCIDGHGVSSSNCVFHLEIIVQQSQLSFCGETTSFPLSIRMQLVVRGHDWPVGSKTQRNGTENSLDTPIGRGTGP